MIGMMKLLPAATATATALLLLVGCSSESTKAAPPNTSTAAPSQEVAPMTQERGIIEAITAAGGNCEELDQRGERRCTLQGVSFKVSQGEAWTQQRDTRKMACDGGYINANYQALTDGHWMIATDHNADLEVIQSALANQGVKSEVRPYCS